MFRPNPFRILVFVLTLFAAGTVFAQSYLHGAGIRPPGGGPPPPQQDNYIGERFPTVWDENQPLEKFLSDVVHRSWLQLEYMHWDLDGPDGDRLGSRITNVTGPEQFTVFDNLSGGTPAGIGFTPPASGIGSDDTSGVRGTLGVGMNGGTLELSVFGTEQGGTRIVHPNVQAQRVGAGGLAAIGTADFPNIVVPLLTNGVAQTSNNLNAFVFDAGYNVHYATQMWGAEALLVHDSYMPQNGFDWQWAAGFRYLNYDEELNQLGIYNAGGTIANRVTRIGGTAINNIYGPEVGGRASLRSKMVTLSATPRIAFALNDHTSTVATGPLVNPADPNTLISAESIDFTPVLQLNMMAQLHLTSQFSLFGGYDFLWIYKTSRVNRNISYDSTPGPGASFTPNIGQSVSLGSFDATGFTAGAMFTY